MLSQISASVQARAHRAAGAGHRAEPRGRRHRHGAGSAARCCAVRWTRWRPRSQPPSRPSAKPSARRPRSCCRGRRERSKQQVHAKVEQLKAKLPHAREGRDRGWSARSEQTPMTRASPLSHSDVSAAGRTLPASGRRWHLHGDPGHRPRRSRSRSRSGRSCWSPRRRHRVGAGVDRERPARDLRLALQRRRSLAGGELRWSGGRAGAAGCAPRVLVLAIVIVVGAVALVLVQAIERRRARVQPRPAADRRQGQAQRSRQLRSTAGATRSTR